VQKIQFTEFEIILIDSENQLGTAILLVLVWIAASDGTIDEKEAKQLSEISVASKHSQSIEPLLRIARNSDIKALQLACEIISLHFQGEKARLFLAMAVGMSIADGYLLPTENYILRFLADLLSVNSSGLNSIFIDITGKNIPDPSDVSSANYWKAKEQSNADSNQGASGKRGGQTQTDLLGQAYSVLGLEYGANMEKIKKAYRHLAQVNHPDRFASLGEESVAAATTTFKKINEAYKYLVKYA